MSWLFSQVLVEEYLGDISSDGEPSVQSSGSHTQQAYCAPDKMTAFSRLSRFGMTYKPLTESRGEELLTLYLAAFHAKTSPQLEREKELTENGQECGEKWHASFTKYDPDSSSWKTHQCSLLGDLDEFSETWPRWGLMRDGECWEQQTLAHRTNETESGLPDGETFFHTPNTSGLDGGSNSRKALKKRQMLPTPTASMMPCEGTVRIMRKQWLDGEFTLEEASAIAGRDIRKSQGKVPMWPTPATKGYGHASEGMVGNLIKKIEQGVITKEEAEAMLSLPKLENHRTWKKNFPTPCQRDYKGKTISGERVTKSGKTQKYGDTLPNVAGGKLNPTWVEWLMGWPLGWTDLKPLETDKFQKWLDGHGKS